MEKQIRALSDDPLTVHLADRECTLFIDPRSGTIFADEGKGDARMNGVAFAAANGPAFSVRSSATSDHQLVLSYCGIEYLVGYSPDVPRLVLWAESANALLGRIRNPGPVEVKPAHTGNA
jgi:hypothetical protein